MDIRMSALLADPVSTVFDACVWVLQVIGDFTGMGYEIANIVIFVVLHPALTVWLFVLWRRALGRAMHGARLSCESWGAQADSGALHLVAGEG